MKIYTGIIAFFIFGAITAQKLWSFNDCLSYAREHNLQVIASKLNEQVQEENYKIAKKQKLPDLTGAVGNSMSFGPLANQRTTGSILGQDLNTHTYYNYTGAYNANLALESSILLYNNGSLKIAEEKNNLLLQQYQFTTEKIKNDISLQLVGNYLTVLLNQELMGVNKNSMDTYQQQANRNLKLYNAGSIPLSTLYESNANLANGKQVYETSIIEIDRSLMILAMLLQKDYNDFQIENVKISDNIDSPLVNVNEVVRYAYGNQPEIKSAELGIEAAKKDVDLARTALFPTITGGYKLNNMYTDYLDRASKSFDDQWYQNHSQVISIGMSIPIFNKGISKIKIEQSKIAQQIQENQLDQQKLTLKQSIQSSYFDVTSSYQTFLSSKESVNSSKLSYEYAQKSFDAGKLNVYDLNIARNNYFNAQSQMLQAKYSYLFRLKILDFYTGKPLQISSDVDNMDTNSIISEAPITPIKSDQNITDVVIEPEKEVIIKSEENTISSQDVTTSPKEDPKPAIIVKEEVTTNTEESKTKEEQRLKAAISQPKKEEIKTPIDTTVTTPEIKKANPKEIKENAAKEKASQKERDENAKREVLIKERRAQLSKGSSSINDNAKREELIKERRAQLSKGLE